MATHGGDRFNTGKIRYDLIPHSWVRCLAEVFTQGARKYAPNNWKKGLKYSDTIASMKRHTAAIERGEWFDPETGCHHCGHIAWNALALMWMHIHGRGTADLEVDTHADPLQAPLPTLQAPTEGVLYEMDKAGK